MTGTRSRRNWPILALVLTFLVGPTVLGIGQAAASDASDADALISRGLKLRQTFQDRQALPLFQEAVQKKKTPRAVAQLGLCELALGLWLEADDHLKQALANQTDPWIHKNEKTLTTAYEGTQDKLGFLDVWGDPTGAQVTVDGRAAGALPWERPLRLAAGRRNLLIEATGFLTDTRTVDVPPRTVAREHVALVRAPAAAQPVAVPLPPPAARTTEPIIGTPTPAGEPSHEPAAESDPVYKRWWFWTAIGVAAVAAGGAAIILSRKDQCQSSGGGACVAW